MSTLTGQFISQSYGGVIQLSTSTGIVTGSSTQLQDGFGTNLGLFIRTSAAGSGSLSGSGDFNINGMTVGVGSGNVLSNTVVGRVAFTANTTGTNNVAVGNAALSNNTTGGTNTAVGTSAMLQNRVGSFNTAIGNTALQNNTSGSNNVAVGYFALQANTSGSSNTAIGRGALIVNTRGDFNTAVGRDALNSNTTGSGNAAIGQEAGEALVNGNNNIFVGYDAGQAFADGSDNIFIGYQSGFGLTTGNGNMIIGKTSSTFTASISQNILLYTSDVQRARFDPTSGWFFNNVVAGTGSYILTYESTGQTKYATYEQVASRLLSEGQFLNTTTITGSAGVSASIAFNNSSSLSVISLVSGSRITVANAATYNIQFSVQLDAPTGADVVRIWFRKNGTNIPNSASKVSLANNASTITTVNIFDIAAANDYYEVVWQRDDDHAQLLGEAASGNYPAVPSIIVTINQVN
jgi:hypothetical protein